jgi:nucleotidyltransferase substrate binding protein (TIGR01987 family)
MIRSLLKYREVGDRMGADLRWKQRFTNFRKATLQLVEFIDKGKLNKFEVQGLIQCFEYTFELAWKTAKDYLELEGFIVKTPRETIKTAFQIQLITDGHIWIDALEKRNLMAHTYDEKRVTEAEKLIRTKYFKIITDLCSKLEELL